MKSKFFAILALIFALFISTAYADGVNVDSGIKFISQTGDIIHTFPDVASSDYTMHASVTVKNESALQKGLFLLVSVYDENYNLKKVMYDTISVPAKGEDTGLVPITIPQGTQESDFVCKASLWDSIEGKVAYRSESRFLDFNTNLYGIEVDGVAVENYSDEEDVYSIEVSKENADIKVYPKSGATSIVYSSINVPGLSRIKLMSGNEKREVFINTYMEDDPYGGEGSIKILPEGIQNISSYALDGYLYEQLKNSWTDFEGDTYISYTTDDKGNIASDFSYSGDVDKDKQVATFSPWKDYQPIGSGTPAYTMHFGFTVAEINSPVYLQYRYRDGGSYHGLLAISANKVVAGDSLSGGNYIEVQAPYTIDIFMNTQTCDGYIYVNNQPLYTGNMNWAGSTQWREVVVKTLEKSTGFKLVTTANNSVYDATIAIQEVIKAYLGEDVSFDEPGDDEPVVVVPEGIQNISEHALEGYFYKQLDNNWSDVTLSNAVDENGIITTTATYSGTLEAGKRVATFQPWEKGKGTRENAAGSYTMHFGFTVNEVTSPLALAYKYDAGGTKYLAVLTSNKVVEGSSIDGSNYIGVTAPYTIDCFMNIQSGEGYVYVNDQLLYQGGMTNSSGDKKWHEVRITSLQESTDIRFVTTAANSSIYKDDITIQDVISAYIGDDETDGDEPTVIIPEAIQNISSYALNGYFYKQLNNHWANITLSDTTNENAVITTTATHEGTLAAGSRVATFQPWEKNKPTFTNAPDAYTMHIGFTVNEITSPVSLKYRFDGNKDLISFSKNKVAVGANMNGSTSMSVTLPYTINMFMDVKTCEGYVYVNDKLLYQGTMKNSSADTKWTEIRVQTLEDTTNFKLVTTAANGSVYNEKIGIKEVVAAYMNDTPADSKLPIIILKLDDLCTDNVNNFQKAFEILQSNNISNAGFGVIGEHLEDSRVTEELISKIKEWNSAGIEIWHHGYLHQESEYSSSDYGKQKENFGKTCDLLKEKTGITITSFGSPFNNANDTTIRVIEENFPQIKCLMLVNADTSITNIRARANFETQVGFVSYDRFVENYEAKLGESAVVMQGHAGAWDDASREEFKKILTYLKEKDAVFMTPTQYAKYIGNDDPTDPDEPGDEGISKYALSGYNKNKIKNSWADGIDLNDDTDAMGIITTTASKSGKLEKGKRVATFEAWASGASVGSAADENTMHFGFTVNEVTSPVYLEYNYAKNGGAKKTLISLSSSKVVEGGSIDGANYIEVTAPYTIDIFMNTKTLEGYIYVNDTLLCKGSLNNSESDKNWNQVRLFSLEEATDFRFVTTAANASVYNNGTTIQDVIKAYLGEGVSFGDESVDPPTDPDEPGDDPVDPPTDPDEPGDEGKVDISEYALSGYNKKQINNNWAAEGIERADQTDANGVITTTATYAGTLAKDTQVATFDPWADRQTVGSDAPAYTMHFGFTVDEISNPVYLQYRYRSSGTYHTLLSLLDGKVAAGDNLSEGTSVAVQLPYTVNIFMNTKTCDGYIYVNDQLIYTGNMNYAGSTQWRQVVVKTSAEYTDFRLVTSKATTSVYNENITIQDVIDAYITR